MQKAFFLFLLLSLISSGYSEPAANEPSLAVNPFVGRWKLVKLDGNPYLGYIVWTFQDTSLTITYGNTVYQGSYRYDPNSDPKTLDLMIQGATPDPNLAIFKFVAPDSFVIKLMTSASTRATNFNVEQNYQLQEFQIIITSTPLSSGELPVEFSLEQNYPNPFNPNTTISYQLPTQSHVTIKVFDVLGREVTTLVDGLEEPGYKSVNFNSNGLSNGVYYYRLQAGSFVETKKLVLLR